MRDHRLLREELCLVASRPVFGGNLSSLSQNLISLFTPLQLDQGVRTTHVGHDGKLQLWNERCDLQGAIVEVERLLRTSELNVSVAEQRQPSHLRGNVAVRLSNLESLPEADHAGSDVALQERHEPQFSLGAVRPCGVAQLLGDGLCFAPRHGSQGRIEILVSLALDHQTAQSQAVVRLDQRMFQVLGQARRHLWNGQSRAADHATR